LRLFCVRLAITSAPVVIGRHMVTSPRSSSSSRDYWSATVAVAALNSSLRAGVASGHRAVQIS